LASHSNLLARQLESALLEIPGVTITQPVEANGVFVIFPQGVADTLAEEFPFYVWNEHTGEVRLMCSWDSTAEDIERIVSRAKELCIDIENG
jgi:threonine aldolase